MQVTYDAPSFVGGPLRLSVGWSHSASQTKEPKWEWSQIAVGIIARLVLLPNRNQALGKQELARRFKRLFKSRPRETTTIQPPGKPHARKTEPADSLAVIHVTSGFTGDRLNTP